MTDSVTVVTPALCLGAGGVKPAAFERSLDYDPDAIAVDAGSLDFGPYYLATGTPFASRGQVQQDFELILTAAADRDIPTIIGTAGGSGAAPHVEWTLDIIDDVATAHDYQLDVAVIGADVDSTSLQEAVDSRNRNVEPLGHEEPLSTEQIEASDYIVGQMGIEPITQALEDDPDVLVAGRACDNAVIGAYPVAAGFPKGLALHMGSILECADFAAKPVPGQADNLGAETHATVPMVGVITPDSFTVEPADDRLQCTRESIVAHSLYERRNPRRSAEPGGILDVSDCTFDVLERGAVRVTGSKFIEEDQYTIKLEGAGTVGHRAISICGVRDPVLVENIEGVLERVKSAMYEKYSASDGGLDISFRIYGKNGVMKDLEPESSNDAHEFGVLAEVVAETAELAKEVCGNIDMRLLHGRYETVPQSGAVALPFSPNTFSVGEAATLTVYHTIAAEPAEFCSHEKRQLGVNPSRGDS